MRAIAISSLGLLTVLAACSSGEETSASGFTTAQPTAGTATATATVPPTTMDATTDMATEPGASTTDGEEATTERPPEGTGHDVTGHDVTGETASTGPVTPPEPACDDGLLNQDESDIDCGGATCPQCGLGETCQGDGDCASGSCIAGECTEPSCSDGAKNGDETDVDCGGGCSTCGDNQGCSSGSDCASQVCMNEVCSPPSCGDGAQNGNETAVDCGGGCMGCGEGVACEIDSDCLSQFCNAGTCAPKECDDNSGCAQFNSACTQGVCTPEKTCVAQNSNEAGACDDGNPCMTGEKCTAGVCGGATAKDCSAMSNQCALGVCDMASGSCTAQAANNGNPCNDGKACTTGEVCGGGTCQDPMNPNGYVFYETFANNNAGWGLGTEWQIGGAAVSGGQEYAGVDPGTDHTPTGDNGVAGVVIGGNAVDTVHGYYYLTSPPINTTAIPGTVWLTFWRWLNTDFPPYMDNRIEVWNGNAWTTVFSGPPDPGLTESAWSQQAFDVTAYKNAGFQFRIGHTVLSAAAFKVASWNVDDVVIGPTVCTP